MRRLLLVALLALSGCEYAGMGPQPELQSRLSRLSDAYIVSTFNQPSYYAPAAPAPTTCPPRRFQYSQSYTQGC